MGGGREHYCQLQNHMGPVLVPREQSSKKRRVVNESKGNVVSSSGKNSQTSIPKKTIVLLFNGRSGADLRKGS